MDRNLLELLWLLESAADRDAFMDLAIALLARYQGEGLSELPFEQREAQP